MPTGHGPSTGPGIVVWPDLVTGELFARPAAVSVRYALVLPRGSRSRLLIIPRFAGGLFRGAVSHGPRSYIAPWRQIVPRCVAVSRKISTIHARSPIRALRRHAIAQGPSNGPCCAAAHRPKGRRRCLRAGTRPANVGTAFVDERSGRSWRLAQAQSPSHLSPSTYRPKELAAQRNHSPLNDFD